MNKLCGNLWRKNLLDLLAPGREERLQRAIPTKEYVDGEGFLYLGRSYRLKLVDEQAVP